MPLISKNTWEQLDKKRLYTKFSPDSKELPPNLAQLLETTKPLTPEQQKLLNDLLKTFKDQ